LISALGPGYVPALVHPAPSGSHTLAAGPGGGDSDCDGDCAGFDAVTVGEAAGPVDTVGPVDTLLGAVDVETGGGTEAGEAVAGDPEDAGVRATGVVGNDENGLGDGWSETDCAAAGLPAALGL
jgi:hypothetical protein